MSHSIIYNINHLVIKRMKKNYTLILAVVSFLFATTTVSAVGITPTEDFYTTITSLPFEPVDSVDMSNSTLAPTVYFPYNANSYPAKGYKLTLATDGTLTFTASSNTITPGNVTAIVSSNYDFTTRIYRGNGTTSTLTAGTYYIALITNNVYGKVKLSMSSTASLATAVERTATEQVQLFAQNRAIVITGLSAHSTINVFNLNGQMVKQLTSSSETEELAMPANGVYLVTINGVSHKVIVL